MGRFQVLRRASYRLFAFSLCFCLFYSSSHASVNALLAALGHVRVLFQSEPPYFSETPGTPDYGSNPAVDPIHRSGIWDDPLREHLYEMQQLEVAGDSFPEASDPYGGGEEGFGGNGASLNGGGGGGVCPPPPPVYSDPLSGRHRWEGAGPGGGSPGAPATVNTNTGNRLTVVPIVSWPVRGGMELDFTLYHNSRNEGLYSVGYGWRTTFDFTIYQSMVPIRGTTRRSAIVQWPDGTYVPYTETAYQSNIYTGPAGIYEKLTRTTGGWRIVAKDQTEYNFNTIGNLVNIRDRSGNQITINRPTGHHATSVTDPTGRTLTFGLTNGRITSVTDPLGRNWQLQYTNNNLTGIRMPLLDGSYYTRTFGYDSAHNITSETDLRGHAWTCAYDGSQRLSWWKTPSPFLQQTLYTYAGSYTTWRLPMTNLCQHHYSTGMLRIDMDPANFYEQYGYDTNRNMSSVRDTSGFTWLYSFDSSGNVLTERRPGDSVDTRFYTYNTKNDLLTFSAPTSIGSKWTFNRDTLGRLTSVDDPGSLRIVEHSYDSYGQRLWTEDGMDRRTNFTYDAHGRLIEVDPPGAAAPTDIGYDLLGRPTSITNVLNESTAIAYDEWGRAEQATNPDNSTVSAQYDREDHPTHYTNELGRTWISVFDAAGRKTQFTNPRGDVENYGYNNNSWLTSVQNGRGHTRNYTYNARGELWKLQMPDTATEYWTYDGRGNLTRYTNPLAQAIQYVYNGYGNLTTVDYPAGTDTTFQYDTFNRATQMVDATGTTQWAYNSNGWLFNFITPQGSVGYLYNNAGQRTSMQAYDQGTTYYTYDTAGRLDTLRNGLNELTDFDYDSLSRVVKKTLSSGAYESYGYDNRSRPTSITVKNSTHSTLSSQSYTYDSAGNVLTHTQDGTQTTYTYDWIDQILSETRTGYSASYTYDGNGNRATKTVGGVTENYAYDSGDKLLDVKIGGVPVKTYQYDAAGRTTQVQHSLGTTTLSYDFEDRLTSISGGGVTASTYTYNGLDTRISKSVGGFGTTFKRDGAYVTDPVLKEGTVGHTPGISVRDGSTTKFSHSGLKNNAVQTSTAQAVTGTKRYDAFGLLSSSTGSWNGPFSYGGPFGYQEDGESGLKLLGHRYYDASTGRFLTRDPIKHGKNWFLYCDNQPVTHSDSTGLCFWCARNAQQMAAQEAAAKAEQAFLEWFFKQSPQVQKFMLTLMGFLTGLGNEAAFGPSGPGGTRLHALAESFASDLASRFGLGIMTEVAYKAGQRQGRRVAGTVVYDNVVSTGNKLNVIMDYKFWQAKLRPKRVSALKENAPDEWGDVPVIELGPGKMPKLWK